MRRTVQLPDRQLDYVEFHKLLSFLIVQCLKGNYSKSAAQLGITRKTLVNWHTKESEPPPHQWYWPLVIDRAIRDTILAHRESTNKETRRRIGGLMHDYRELTDQQSFQDFIANERPNPRRYLLSLFRTRSIISTKYLARENVYSLKRLSRAASQLGLTAETSGFGDKKQTFYELPEWDETDEDTVILAELEDYDTFEPDEDPTPRQKRR